MLYYYDKLFVSGRLFIWILVIGLWLWEWFGYYVSDMVINLLLLVIYRGWRERKDSWKICYSLWN